MNLSTGVSGEYRLVINRPDGSQEDTGWFPNLILDQGLDRLGNSASGPIIRYAHVGSGTTTPNAAQTSLTTFVASADSNPTNYAESCVNEGSPTYAALHTWRYIFAQGAVVGNITEIGVGWSTSGATLFSRALILDGTGSPTTITLVAIDQLTVYYRLRVAPTLTDLTGVVDIGGTNYNYTVRVASAGNFANTQFMFNSSSNFSNADSNGIYPYPATSVLGSITGTPSGTVGVNGTATTAAYTPGTYYRDSTFNLSISQGNTAGGIGALRLVWPTSYSVMLFQVGFSPAIPKDNTKTFSITMRHSWARA